MTTKTRKLSEICHFQGGYSFRSNQYQATSENAYDVFRMGNIARGGGINHNANHAYINKSKCEGLDRFVLEKNDLVMSMTDMKSSMALLGHTALIPESGRFILNQRVGMLRVKDPDIVDIRYLYYFTNLDDQIQSLRSRANSGVQVNLTTTAILESDITLPAISEQRAIAGILGALDDKIELNRRMNRTLESMARAVFRQWFVESIEVSKWGTSKIGELAELDKGVSYKGAFLTDEGMPMINLGCFLGKGRFEIDKLKPYSGEYKERHTVKPGDIVLANTDITQKREVIGSPAIVPDYPAKEYLFTHHTYALRVNDDSPILKHYLYFTLLQEEFRERAEGFATGTTVLALPRDAVLDYEIPMPPSNVLQSFYEQVQPMLQMVQSSIKESRTLGSLRDSLLPKLMRGEVRVKI